MPAAQEFLLPGNHQRASSPSKRCGRSCWRVRPRQLWLVCAPAGRGPTRRRGSVDCAQATAPAMSRLRMYLSPRLLVRPKRSLPPLEFCRGVIPSQADHVMAHRCRERGPSTPSTLLPRLRKPGGSKAYALRNLGAKRKGATGRSEQGRRFHRRRPALSPRQPAELLPVPPHNCGRRLQPNTDVATLVDICGLGCNAPHDILGGQYRCHRSPP